MSLCDIITSLVSSQVDMALAAGLRAVTWSSLNIQTFFQSVSSALQEFKTFNKKVCVIL